MAGLLAAALLHSRQTCAISVNPVQPLKIGLESIAFLRGFANSIWLNLSNLTSLAQAARTKVQQTSKTLIAVIFAIEPLRLQMSCTLWLAPGSLPFS